MNLVPPDIDSIRNLPEALFSMGEVAAIRPAQWYRKHGEYLPITYAQLVSSIRHVASGLMLAGVKPGDRIGLLMENRPEWAVIDYAILSVGAVTVPLYCTYRPQDMAYVLKDSGASIVFTSGGHLLRDLQKAAAECAAVKRIYAVDDSSDDELVHNLTELEGCDADDQRLNRRLAKIGRDQLATIVYTSGTTANPKGVILTHGNILTNLETVPAVISLLREERMLSFLPLAHTLERTASHFLPYSYGISVAFAERPDTVAKNMAEARPTIMVAVPRMLEVVRNRILSQVGKQPPLKQKLFHSYFYLAGKANPGPIGGLLLKLLDKLVGEKIRGRFGGRLRVMVSGGAPLSVEVGQFFETLKMPVLEGYGLTESAPLLAANPMHDRRIGTVGLAGKGVEIKIAEDGEIIARGNNIMPGYWKNKVATKEALIDGWLHTGDIGEIDKDGYLKITDRKKDIIVNSGGENIAPQRIEGLLVASEEIDQAVVYGDLKPYLVALIIPNQEASMAWAKQQGLPETDWDHLCGSEIFRKHLQTRISAILKPLNPFEQVRRIHLLHRPFTIEAGLMTPTMKIKRRKVYEQYRDNLESLYS
ncbi:long-chain acyl-CoA synthetase [Mariprofundus aestuarium]|uniref:Long-chain acyl-CoA synthetase n=1 Tax=Mariprofundus aestuarium TaxID=1921086 RepID=A0A2K8L7D9_MARES|nr:long-chain fatty acid--CoA ligase [Mariprofundus aestuarium]ATX80854.1 long-chain acyl-CoA synthetase [Mariprofundus aestuarium]